jgi:hypothetical protein
VLARIVGARRSEPWIGSSEDKTSTHYLTLLATDIDEQQRNQILKLLAEEQEKQKDSGDHLKGVLPQL